MGIPVEFFNEDNPNKGYRWSIMHAHGVIEIEDEVLRARPEYACIEGSIKQFDLIYSHGWRWNVDNQKWHRIKGY